MLFNLKKIFFFFCVVVSPQLINAHFHRLFYLEKSNCPNVYLFGDLHESKYKKNQINTKQRKDFIEFAQQLEAAVIVEDYSIYNKSDYLNNTLEYNNYNFTSSLLFNLLELDKNVTVLKRLTSLCYHSKIPVINAEFRFLEELNDLNKIEDLYNQLKKEIENYNDGPELYSIYQKGLEQCRATIHKKINSLKTTSAFNDFFEENINQWFEIGLLLSPLLDMRILHILENQYKNQKTVFIAAGSWHTQNLCNYLIKLGYTLKHSRGAPYVFCEVDALDIREIFEEWGIKIQMKKRSILSHILGIKNFLERSKLEYFINVGSLFYGPLYCVMTDIVNLGWKPLIQENELTRSVLVTPVTILSSILIFKAISLPILQKTNSYTGIKQS